MQHQHFSSSLQFCPKFVENSLDNKKMGTKKRKESRRKKVNGSKGVGVKFGGKKPHQVARRNERERKRVQQVNNGYELLAGTLTKWEAICGDKKLTKAETLKAAILYIRHLENVLHSPQTMNNNNGPMKRESETVEMVGDDWLQTAMNSPLTTSSSPSECAKNASEISPNFASQNANFYDPRQISYRPNQQQQGHQAHFNSNNLFQQSAFTFDYI